MGFSREGDEELDMTLMELMQDLEDEETCQKKLNKEVASLTHFCRSFFSPPHQI
jgi:hypothetical protein